MKLKVLPDPDSPELMAADKNSATRVLAVAIYLKVEHLFFDDTSSRMDIATAFQCNLSQLTKAVMVSTIKEGHITINLNLKQTQKEAATVSIQIRTQGRRRKQAGTSIDIKTNVNISNEET